jgi:uncharacterized protein with HEPN domain
MRGEAEFLRDMLDSAVRLQRELVGKSYAFFLADETLQDAVVLRLMIIGEAAKKISTATRATLAGIPFDEIARMRDVMVHVYWRINHRIVWDTAIQDVPVLIRELTTYLDSGGVGGVTT